MNKHTPLPWATRPTSRRTSQSDRVDIVGGDRGQFSVATYVREDDAAVIVATSDLLAALDEALDLFEHEFTYSDGSVITDHVTGKPVNVGAAWVQRARAAITKQRRVDPDTFTSQQEQDEADRLDQLEAEREVDEAERDGTPF